MPTYVYKTEDGDAMEVTHSMKAAPLTRMFVNGKWKRVRRVPQTVHTSFRGSGWARR